MTTPTRAIHAAVLAVLAAGGCASTDPVTSETDVGTQGATQPDAGSSESDESGSDVDVSDDDARVDLGAPDEPPAASCVPVAGEIVRCETPPRSADASPFAADGGAKDVNWTWDGTRRRLVWGTGDFSSTYAGDTGNASLFGHDLSANTWSVVSTICHPTGQISPNHVTDRGAMVHDPKRDAIWLLWSDPYPEAIGTTCGSGAPGWPTGSTYAGSILRFDMASATWSQPVQRETGSVGRGYYDTAGDRIVYVAADASGCASMTSVALDDPALPESRFSICYTPSPAWSGTDGGWLPSQYLDRESFAWDDAGRRAFIVSYNFDVSAAGDVRNGSATLLEVDLHTQQYEVRAAPPLPMGFLDGYDLQLYNNLVWDSTHQRVVWPVTTGSACAKVAALLVYDPVTDAWESSTPANLADVTAGSVAYDPVADAVVMAGTSFCDPAQSNRGLYLYRYEET